jgi:protein TonB
MLELKPRPIATPSQEMFERKQPRRLLLALALLLTALAAVVIRDRQFWFGSDDSTIDADTTTTEVTQKTVAKAAPATEPAKAAAPHTSKKSVAAPAATAEPAPAESGVVATRTVLPPLDVEVVAGDKHSTMRPGSNATKLEITNSGSLLKSAPAAAPATNAAERESIAAAATPNYPLLAQHMNVQGSVVLQALIGTDGVVQNLRVLNGPPILVSAAQQAVREWRFKPIVQNGQAVESKATITVNFNIKVADNAQKTTLAESRAAESLIITR